MGMGFTCEHCGEAILGVAAIHNGKIMHHRCADAYTAKLAKEKWKASGLLEGLDDTDGKINLADLYEGKAKQIISSE
jgi:hypothetical protein